MNLLFALKGIVALFIFTVLCRFVLALPLSIITTEIQKASVTTGVEASVGPILAMIANVFTVCACLFGIGIVVILLAIAFNGGGFETGGDSYEGNRYTRM